MTSPTIPRPAPLEDFAPFEAPDGDLPARYGLPPEVAFCSRCVISNQRPNSAVEYQHTTSSKKATIHLDAAGVCDACHQADRKAQEIDWASREAELRALCDRARSRDGSYDCLVPGSGGKDSFYAAHRLKYEFGMNPLTVTWAPHIYTPWGWDNFQAWIHAGFDNYLHTPNGRSHRLLTRLAVEKLFHPFQPFIVGQKAFAPRMAVKMGIPLVFYGENEAEYGNPIATNDDARRRAEFYQVTDEAETYLSGVSVRDLKQSFGLGNDLAPYLPDPPAAYDDLGVEVHYLGYYLRWHPQGAYYYAVQNGGFRPAPERTPGTYSKYNSIDDRIDDFHYYTTYIKFGIGRATYDAAQEVRNDEIDRDEAVALVRKFDGEFPERFADEVFRYLSVPPAEFPEAAAQFEQPVMDREYFDALADRFRSPHLWRREGDRWRLRHTVFGSA